MHFVQECTAIVFLVFTITYVPAVSSAYLRAVFDMSDIRGEIRFTEGANGHTRISPNLEGITSNLSWKIHKYPVVYRGNHMHTCQDFYTGGMFDPTGKSSGENYTTRCNDGMKNMCAIGDLSGKHGHLNSSNVSLLDPNLPLNGSNSIFGRSVVLYLDGSTPWACALIDYDDVITAVTTFRGANSGVTGTVRLRQPRGSTTLDTSVEIDLFYSNDATKGSYNWTLEIADNSLPEDGRPSFEGNHCKIATTRVISNHVNIPLAREGPFSERLHFSVNDLPLTGSMSVVGKTLVLKHNGNPTICGSIYEVVPIEAEALFNVDGVSGSFHFKQDSELAPTVVTADIEGLGSKANTYHVHVYRVLDDAMQRRQNAHGMCSNSHVAGHWKPYGTTSASPGTGTVDKYEVGDLSGKYGIIGAKDTLSLVQKDYNLPLFGGNSILFRSMVLHYNNGSRWVCSNINPKNAEFRFKVKAEFIGPDFNGDIIMEQASFVKTHAASHITTFFLNLNYMNNSNVETLSHKWHVHDQDIVKDQMSPMDERCNSAKGHYNPYKVSLEANYSSTCGPKNLLRCELGDTSSKVGKYNIGGGKNRFTESENYFAGLNTILGRSIVVHAKDSGGHRVGCANMKLISKSFVRKELIFKKTTPAHELSQLLATALKINHWRVNHNTAAITDYKMKCQKTSFLLIDSTSSNLGNDFEELKKDWPDNLEKFKPVSEDECSHGFNLQATSLVLAVGLLLTRLMV
ncbi:Superoxide dismutase [Cu-Zn] 1 [Paramuricea clavata]|uniref:Superoxide dismutase [Cu-Zn] 1 n=1 Tax=Paramuricea clavata TaxID=317549 RepID=A0A6S7I7L1_PARCT|nr:Superoxide dismutase [Cu-Zn] 1 [Paramuricea clavata]